MVQIVQPNFFDSWKHDTSYEIPWIYENPVKLITDYAFPELKMRSLIFVKWIKIAILNKSVVNDMNVFYVVDI